MSARAAAAGLVLAALLTGCGSDGRSPDAVGTPRAAPTATCPDKLAATEAGDGMGLETDATAKPVLPAPDAAWLCVYTSSNDGLPFVWERASGPAAIVGNDLDALTGFLEQVDVPVRPENYGCTSDMGPRYAVVATSGSQQFALVLDAFGCRAIRLTDDLGTVPAGSPEGPGTVPGIVEAPDGFRDLVVRLAGDLY